MMKKILITPLLAACVWAGFAARGAEEAVPPVIAALREIARKQTVEPQTPRYLLVINAQTLAPEVDVQAVHQAVAADLRVPVRLQTLAAEKAPGDAAAAEAWRAKADTNCVAVVVLLQRRGELPALTLAIDSRWALVNLDALGKAPGKQLSERVRRQINRGFGTLFGTGFTRGPGEADVMVPVMKGADELDKAAADFGPTTMQSFLATAQAFGLEPVTQLGYRQLAVKGKVPPTNPKLWPNWEKRHKKGVAETFKELGLDPEATMAELRKVPASQMLDE